MGAMDGIVDALEAQQAELTGLLEGLDDAGWARPSPCEGWDVADVVLHLVQTNVMAQASLDDAPRRLLRVECWTGATAGRQRRRRAPAPWWSSERGAPNAELLRAVDATGAARLTARFRAGDPSRARHLGGRHAVASAR